MIQLQDKHRIFVFTGPDGSGRKTVAKLVGDTLGILRVISYCTRNPRPGETDGQDYHFITREQFEEADRRGEFLERIQIGRHLYGVKDEDVEALFRLSGCIYVVVNAEGAELLKQLYGDQVTRIFVYADRDTVRNRQEQLGLPEDVIEEHMSRYDETMLEQPRCEYVVPNYELAHTVFEVTKIIEGYLDRNLVEDF